MTLQTRAVPLAPAIALLLACGSRTELPDLVDRESSTTGGPNVQTTGGPIGPSCPVAIEKPAVCPTGALTIATPLAPVAMRTDATHIVYTTVSGVMKAPSALLQAIPLDGGAPVTLFTYETETNQFAWTLRGGHVYLNDWRGSILRVPVDGGAPTKLASLALGLRSWFFHFVADESWLYLGQRDNKGGTERLFRLPLSGGVPEQLAEVDFTWGYTIDYTPSSAVEVAVDGCSLYWLHEHTIPRNGGSNRDGTVYRIPKGGGERTAVISGLTTPEWLTLTHEAIWVLDLGDDRNDGKHDRFVGVGKDGSARAPVLFEDRSMSHFVVDFGRHGDVLDFEFWTSYDKSDARSGWWTRSLDSASEPTPIDGLTATADLYTATIDRGCGHLYTAGFSRIQRQPLP